MARRRRPSLRWWEVAWRADRSCSWCVLCFSCALWGSYPRRGHLALTGPERDDLRARNLKSSISAVCAVCVLHGAPYAHVPTILRFGRSCTARAVYARVSLSGDGRRGYPRPRRGASRAVIAANCRIYTPEDPTSNSGCCALFDEFFVGTASWGVGDRAEDRCWYPCRSAAS